MGGKKFEISMLIFILVLNGLLVDMVVFGFLVKFYNIEGVFCYFIDRNFWFFDFIFDFFIDFSSFYKIVFINC